MSQSHVGPQPWEKWCPDANCGQYNDRYNSNAPTKSIYNLPVRCKSCKTPLGKYGEVSSPEFPSTCPACQDSSEVESMLSDGKGEDD